MCYIIATDERRCDDTNVMNVKRGDIFFANLYGSKEDSSVQCGRRPVIIIQNNVGNRHSPTTIIAPLTSKMKKRNLPTHAFIRADEVNGLRRDSVALLEQVQAMDKTDLCEYVGSIEDMTSINKALMVSVGLTS